MQRTNKDIILLAILACLWAVQAAVALRQLLGLWRASFPINDMLLPEAVQRMAPKWDLAVYITFIAVALTAGALIFRYYRQPVNYWLLIFEGAVAFLMVSAVFKMLVYFNSPQLAQIFLIVLLIISIVGKIFYPELRKTVEIFYRRVNAIGWGRYADAWWLAVIVLMIYMPDLERVMALIYIGDWVHHFDFFLMSPGWVALCGHVPFVEYGLGLPVIFAKIINGLGNFDYVPALAVMMWFVIIYFIITYFFVRYWLRSALMGGVAFLLVFRLQMFHYGVSPLVWCTLSASPVRFGLDILWMALLLVHMRTGRSRWLILAALYSGFAVYYMTSVGMCVMVSYFAYLLALPIASRQSPVIASKKKGIYYLCWTLPFVSAFLFFGITLKGLIFQKEYWHNLIDYMQMFERFGSLPMYESLKYRHFWAFFMSMVMPFTYIITLLYTGACLYLRKGPMERLFLAVLSVYGLTNYQYYVVRSAITSYYVNVLPFVLIVCFWFMRCLEFLPLIWQKRIKAVAVILSFYALLTNQNYLAYPNLLNFSRNPMTDNLVIQRYPDRTGFFNSQYKKVREEDKLPVNDLGQTQEDMRTEDDFKNDQELADYFHRQFEFRQDAALIDRLTKSQERVALLSSFETKILMQAKRAPFFYHFCVLSSRPMTFRTLPPFADAPRTPDFLSDTIGEFEERRPEYVFMEKVFLQDHLPASYVEGNARILAVVDYVKSHYQPVEQGQYLVAMKRVGMNVNRSKRKTKT
jgi:hypothetical protein